MDLLTCKSSFGVLCLEAVKFSSGGLLIDLEYVVITIYGHCGH